MKTYLNHTLRVYDRESSRIYEVSGIDYKQRIVRGIATKINLGSELSDTILKDFSFDQVEIVVFTGKVDKNNQDIYEGDEIEYGDDFKNRGIVKWDYRRLCWIIYELEEGNAVGRIFDLADVYQDFIHVLTSVYGSNYES